MEINVDIREKTFIKDQKPVTVLDDIHLTINSGDFITVIGPSGCGKSTLLKIIAGLDIDYEGSIVIGSKEVKKPSIEKGFIFQEHRLFPWLTVEQNIAANLPLKKPEIRAKVSQLIDIVRLNGYEKAYPKELSGGMSHELRLQERCSENQKYYF